MATDLEHQRTLDATLRAVVALLDKQALVHQLVARTDTRKHALVQSLIERQHAVELEKKLNSLHPADAAFVLESLQQQQRMTAWQLIARERRGAVLLELAESVRASLVTLLDEPELISLGRQMDAEDLADLVQDLPQERVDKVLAQLGSEERAEVQSVLSFPDGSVGALMQLDAVTVPLGRHASRRSRRCAAARQRAVAADVATASSTATTCSRARCRSISCSFATAPCASPTSWTPSRSIS